MILPMINNKGVVAKIPYPPKALLTNQGKNGIAEENIKECSTHQHTSIPLLSSDYYFSTAFYVPTGQSDNLYRRC